MTPKNRPKENFDANSRRLTAIHEWLNPIHHGNKPLKAAFVNIKGDSLEK
jgi:hypothetical protein